MKIIQEVQFLREKNREFVARYDIMTLEMDNEIETLCTKIKTLQRQYAASENDNQLLQERIENFESKTKVLEEQIQTLQSKEEEYKKHNEALQNKIEYLKCSNNIIETQNLEFYTDLTKLTLQLNSFNAERALLVEEINQTNSINNFMLQSNTLLNTKIKKLQQSYLDIEDECKALQDRNNALEQENKNLIARQQITQKTAIVQNITPDKSFDEKYKIQDDHKNTSKEQQNKILSRKDKSQSLIEALHYPILPSYIPSKPIMEQDNQRKLSFKNISKHSLEKPKIMQNDKKELMNTQHKPIIMGNKNKNQQKSRLRDLCIF